MKNPISATLCFNAMVAALVLAGTFSPRNAGGQTQPSAPMSANVTPVPDNPATPVVPPPDIPPNSPLAQVVRLTQAGVEQGVIATYVANSTGMFNLDSDKIIYLSDLGVPNTLISAMMQRDQQLQQQFAAAQPAQPPPPAPVSQTAPAGTTDVAVQPEAQPAPVTVNYFYNTLLPYGTWVVVNGYGRCWRPALVAYNPSWQPYCDRGHWVYTDCGWYWVSDYAWGATFHYGRWFRDATFGWCWYPDTVWAPSWVTWRYSNTYCGWAPLPPGTAYQTGVGIVYNGGGVSVGFSFGLGASSFVFVPTQYFCDAHPRNYCAGAAQVTQIYNNTTVINNYNVNNRTLVNHGIPAQNIANATRTTLRPVPVREINDNAGAYGRPGYGQGANRPAFTGNSSSHPSAAPQYHSPPPVNQNLWPERNNMGDAVPQRTTPPASYDSPAHDATVQAPAADYSQPQAPVRWQQTIPAGTPRSVTRYYEKRQNYSEPDAAAAPQQTAPASSPASSQTPPGGGHNGNQNGPQH